MSENPLKKNLPLKSGRFFSTDHLRNNLPSHSVRGGAFSVVGQSGKFLFGFISTVVLARLLRPEDFGLIAMVVAITGFLEMFKDLGLSMATVQRKEISHEQVSTLFWVNVGISILFVILTIALAPVLAWFYDDHRLTMITVISAFGFLLGGLTVQHQALLTRQMHFGKLALIDICAVVTGTATGIALALNGAGYWALVFMSMASGITSVFGVWLVCGWRPSGPKKTEGVKSMLAFGGHLLGFNVLNYFARNMDDILIGRFWGAAQLGLYSKAYTLLLLPISQINQPISTVAISGLSTLQDDDGAFKAYYLKTLSILTTVTLPISVLIIVFSKQIILLVLGNQWIGAVLIFQFLAISMVVQPIGNTAGWIYIAKGQTEKMLKYSLFGVLLILLSFLAGLPWGTKGVALAYSIAIWVWIVPCMYLACSISPINLSDILRAIKYPFICSILGGVIAYILKNRMANLNDFYIILLGTIFYFLIYIILLTLIFKQKSDISGYLKLLLQKSQT